MKQRLGKVKRTAETVGAWRSSKIFEEWYRKMDEKLEENGKLYEI